MLRYKRPSRSFHAFVFFIIFISGFLITAQRLSLRTPHVSSDPVLDKSQYADIRVDYVYDGDTIRLADGEKVRFLGIDTPESSQNKKLFRDAARSGQDIKDILAMGHAAAEYTRVLLKDRRVRLEFDIEKRDKYGRLLAYIYRVDDGLFINEDIIKNGYAYPMTIPPNIRFSDRFKQLFREARNEKRGLWATDVNRE